MRDAYNGARFEVLRHIQGLTQREFGARLDLTQSQLSRIEHGTSPLTEDVAARASQVFGEPLSFFRVTTAPVPLGPAAFRRKAATKASERDRVSELYREAARVFHRISEESGYHQIDADLLRDDGDIEEASARVRSLAGLAPEQPVKNVVRMLERLGVGVVTTLDEEDFAQDRADLSGISMPTANNRRPVVATTSIGRGDVQRMTLAHELGHVVLHHDAPAINCSSRHPQEKDAYAVAASILAPRRVMEKRIHERSTLRDFLSLKAEFGLSASGGVMHARRLGIISDDRARALHMQIQARQWKYDEPVDVPHEKPLLLKQAMAKVYPTSTYARASHELGVRPERLIRWADGRHDDAPTATITVLRPRASTR